MNLGNKVVYQIYPKSFQDSNGDGLGDLAGIISRLDYLAELGADYLWITPFFVSPQYDNGYDIADYRRIDPRYGTMKEFETLVAEAGKRNMYLMMDMVFNHCSTRTRMVPESPGGGSLLPGFLHHPRRERTAACLPTNWVSKFGGSAWGYLPGHGRVLPPPVPRQHRRI